MGAKVELKNSHELALMRKAGRVVSDVLDALERAARAGMSTWELDRLAEEITYERGAKPAFKGYLGFPASLCASVNEEVVHGIPSRKRVLREGDLLKLDFGASYEGYFADAARTVAIGKGSAASRRLMESTRDALERAIAQMCPGNSLGDLGHAIQSHVEALGFSVVRDFVGHGIGRSLHEPPHVPNFGKPGKGLKLAAGMVLAIEPMVNQGSADVRILADDWTAVTEDGQLSAHFEHTVLVTEAGPEVLTRP